jgi:sugar lactone lactonase YvrE
MLVTSFAGLLGLAVCVGGCTSSGGGWYHKKHSHPTPTATATATATPTATPTPIPITGRAALWVPNASGNSVDAFSLSQIATTGNPIPEVDISGASTGLNNPFGLCFDASNNLWVVNLVGSKQPGTITEYLAGELSGGGDLTPYTTISGSNTGLVAPAQCDFDSSGNLWVVNIDGNSIADFTPAQLAPGGTLNIAPTVTITGENDLCNPPGLTFDGSGNAWVTGLCFNNLAEFKKSDLASSGSPAFTTEIMGSNTQFNQPFAPIFDQSGNAWVANSAQNGGTAGVLEFKASDFAGGGSLNIAPLITVTSGDMNVPYGIAFDADGNLWVSQSGSNALTGFKASDLTGTVVLTPFSVVSGSNTKLNRPVFILFHSLPTDLAVADITNNRVTLYKRPFSNGEAAHKVIGQPDFTSTASGTTQSTLNNPTGIATDPSGNGWVADTNHDRVLEFTPPFSTGMNASVVLGQTDFTTSGCTTTATGLCDPFGVAADSSGDIWVADDGNCRVLEFEPPFSNGMAASVVLGQANFTTSTCSTTQSTFHNPTRLTFDKSGDLWASEAASNRVLEFTPPFTNGMNASLVLGQSDFTSNTAATTATGLANPIGVAFDSAGNLWVAEYYNCRAVEYVPPFTTGMAASVVLGEPDFTTANCASGSASATGNVAGVAIDSSGNAYVSDFGNARVLEFSPPFSSGMAASVVFGQSDFTGSSCNQGGTAGAATICAPEGLAIDITP